MAIAPKVYDFPLAKVEDQLVSFLKKKRGESTVADMIAGHRAAEVPGGAGGEGGAGRVRRVG